MAVPYVASLGWGCGTAPVVGKTQQGLVPCHLLSHRLKFKFKRGSLPPTMPLEFVGCMVGVTTRP